METRESIRSMLAHGDRRSIGRVAEVLARVEQTSRGTPLLITCLDDPDPGVRMRAADALEKLSRENASRLARFKPQLMTLLAEATQKELRWHLAVIIPRLPLTPIECRRAADVLETYLEDGSSIVRAFAVQGLFDLSGKEPGLQQHVLDLLRLSARSGTPATRARARILLKKLDRE